MSLSLGRIKRYEPNLYAYERKTRFDTTPVYVKLTINNFYCHHVPISLNKRDVVERRHPIYPAQFEVKQAMLRYQTTNELWHQFIEDHHDMAMAMQNEKQPHTAPMLFRSNAPWEMRKAKDSGCLCKDCKRFHLVRRGVIGASAAIEKQILRGSSCLVTCPLRRVLH